MRTGSTRRRSYVPVIGFKNFASRTPVFLNGGTLRFAWVKQSVVWPFHLPDAAALYQHGGGPAVPPRMLAACRFFNIPIIKHWLGTDVTRAALPIVLAQNATGQITHWANSPWLVDELAQAGIPAQIVSNVGVDGVVLPMPPGPLTVLVFFPDFDFYGGPDVMELAREFPQIRFLAVATDRAGREQLPNVEYLGYRNDMQDVYGRCHVLLRLPKHDGKSRMICEALAFGRHAIWKYPMFGSRLATTRHDAALLLRRFDAALRAGRLRPNVAGHDYILRTESHHVVRDHILSAMSELIEMWPTTRREARTIDGKRTRTIQDARADIRITS